MGYNVPTAITMNLLASSSNVRKVNHTTQRYPELIMSMKRDNLFSTLLLIDLARGAKRGSVTFVKRNADPSVMGRSNQRIVKNSNSYQFSAIDG